MVTGEFSLQITLHASCKHDIYNTAFENIRLDEGPLMQNITQLDLAPPLRVVPAITDHLAVAPTAPPLRITNGEYDMVVFCHLRWEFVYQRPQHIISRMAKHQRILFIEEPLPVEEGGKPSANLRVISPNLHLLQPRTGSIADIKNILSDYVDTRSIKVGWFYSPAFVPLLQYFNFDTIVYDCMDELTLFKGAANELQLQERSLINKADVIFTGGKSLYESKKKLHKNVHCFPSSVDQPHFAQALNGVTIPDDIRNIRVPIAGYFGVIDERIDLHLLDETALLNPDLSFVMIGPLAKISEADLPRRANIHYLGMKSYAELPGYLKAFTVAIMPFALNDATRYISPTKTLEYMAAGKPVISTPIKDVQRDYSHCVHIVESPVEFSRALRLVVGKEPVESMTNAYSEILANTSWDSTVNRMDSLISCGSAR